MATMGVVPKRHHLGERDGLDQVVPFVLNFDEGDSGMAHSSFSLSYREQMRNKAWKRSRAMLVVDASTLLGIAAILTSLSALIWSVRRKA